MEVGQIFEVQNKEYGFLKLTQNKCVQALDLERGVAVQFKMKASKEYLIPQLEMETNYEISKETVDFRKKQLNQELESHDAMKSMKRGDKFIGHDGNTYTFIEVKRTRFSCERNGETYNAHPGFIKEVL
jgi:hypothetical protein